MFPKERLQELVRHIRVLRMADERSGRLLAMELKEDIEALLEDCISKADE
jgi:hypothetical protein